ncbi:MAG: PrsW family intramembrane metalloprotease [Oscillospiraceae bacterium]|nr:PrsW family intramembrane metalloprotease [Oscillospiraceae bacterium]
MGILISLPVSLLLLWLVLKPKKDDPYPRGGVARLLVAGALSTVVASVVSLLLSGLIALIRIGPATVAQIFRILQDDPYSLHGFLDSVSPSREVSPLRVLFITLITVGLVEELSKYVACRTVIHRLGMICTRMDAVICFTVTALAFEVFENITYASQTDALTAFVRNLAPVHFCCGVIMGWYYGRFLVTGGKKFRWLSVLVPALIHTVYDTGLTLMGTITEVSEGSASGVIYFFLGLFVFLAAFVLTIVFVVKLVEWCKKGTLDVPVAGLPADSAP